jgi:hypothetical protein
VKLDLFLTDAPPFHDGKYAVHCRRDNILLFSAWPLDFDGVDLGCSTESKVNTLVRA